MMVKISLRTYKRQIWRYIIKRDIDGVNKNGEMAGVRLKANMIKGGGDSEKKKSIHKSHSAEETWRASKHLKIYKMQCSPKYSFWQRVSDLAINIQGLYQPSKLRSSCSPKCW